MKFFLFFVVVGGIGYYGVGRFLAFLIKNFFGICLDDPKVLSVSGFINCGGDHLILEYFVEMIPNITVLFFGAFFIYFFVRKEK